MKKSLITTGVIGIAAATAMFVGGATKTAAPAPALAAGTYGVDGTHASVVFRITHLGVSNFYGRFNDITGTFKLDPEDAAGSMIDIKVAADSIDTNNAGRERHLKGPDFFNVRQFPEITFKSKRIETAGDKTFRVTGDITMLGQTKTIDVDVTTMGEINHPRFKQRSGLDTTFTIKRSDFGMTYMVEDGGLGDEVQLIVALEGIAPGS